MIRTFETYDHERSKKINEMFDAIDNIHSESNFMNVRILRGIMNIAKASEYINFSIFGVNYQFKITEDGDLGIYGGITDDNTNRTRYEAELDDEEFDTVYKNVMIAVQFDKVSDLKGNKDYRDILERFETFFYNWDNNKPDTFYKEYVKFFKEEPWFLSVIEWNDEKMKGFTEEERNLIKSSKSGEKYKLFESKRELKRKVFSLIENLYVEKEGGNFGTFVILSGVFDIWKEDEPDCYGFHVFDESYSVCSDIEGKYHLSNSSFPMEDDATEKLIKNIKILSNFKKLYSMRSTHNTKQMSKELIRFFEGGNNGYYEDNDPEDFYSFYYDYFQEHPEYLSLVDFPEDKLKEFTEEERNNIRSSKGGSKYKLFGESLSGINDALLDVHYKSFYDYLLDLKDKHGTNIDVLGGYLVIDFDINQQDYKILVTVTLGGSDVCFTWDNKLRYYVGDPQRPREEITDKSHIEEMMKTIEILMNFVDVKVDGNDEDSLNLFNYISNEFHLSKGFYTRFLNTFKNQPNMLKFIDWNNPETTKGFSEEDKNLVKSVKSGSKYKIFGESLNERRERRHRNDKDYDYGNFLDDMGDLEHWMNNAFKEIEIDDIWLSFQRVLSSRSSNFENLKKVKDPKGMPKYFPFRARVKLYDIWQKMETLDEFTSYLYKIVDTVKKNLKVDDVKLMEGDYIEFLIEIDEKAKDIIDNKIPQLIRSEQGIDKYNL
jgi:hypothetical protein